DFSPGVSPSVTRTKEGRLGGHEAREGLSGREGRRWWDVGGRAAPCVLRPTSYFPNSGKWLAEPIRKSTTGASHPLTRAVSWRTGVSALPGERKTQVFTNITRARPPPSESAIALGLPPRCMYRSPDQPTRPRKSTRAAASEGLLVKRRPDAESRRSPATPSHARLHAARKTNTLCQILSPAR